MSILKGGVTQTINHLSFDGVNDRVLLPDTTVFNFNNQDFRVDVTFNANDVNSLQHIFTKSEDFNNPGGCNGWGFGIVIENGGLKVSYVTESPSCAGNSTNSVSINANQTYEVSARWTDGVKMEIFLDNVLVETHNNTNSNLRDFGFSHIGTFRDNNGNFVHNFDGNVYYLSVYNNGIKNAEYLFNEESGTTLNDNVGTNDGTIVGATWVESGQTIYPAIDNIYYGAPSVQTGLQFDGVNDYVEVNGINNITSGGDITIEIKVSAPNLIGANDDTNILLNYIGPNNEDGWFVRFENSQIWFRTFGGNNNGGSGYTFNENQTYMISLVWDPGNYHKLYVDGVLIDTYNNTDTIPTLSNVTLQIARRLTEFFDGDIKELRIWNDIRTDTEISNNWNQLLSGNESNLALYYNFNEGSGITLNDLSGNNNNATIYGATWESETLYPTIDRVYAGQELIFGEPLPTFYLSFDGNDYVDLGSPSNLVDYDGTSVLEVTFSTTSGYGTLYGNRIDLTPASWYILETRFDGTARFLLRPDDNTIVELYLSSIINDGQKHTIKFKSNNPTHELYLDGVLEDTVTSNVSNFTLRVPINIGRRENNNSGYFNGNIYDIKVYDDYNETQLISHWDFSDGSGNVLTDKVGNNDGTIVGATWVQE